MLFLKQASCAAERPQRRACVGMQCIVTHPAKNATGKGGAKRMDAAKHQGQSGTYRWGMVPGCAGACMCYEARRRQKLACLIQEI